jgi:hypothetical protein
MTHDAYVRESRRRFLAGLGALGAGALAARHIPSVLAMADHVGGIRNTTLFSEAELRQIDRENVAKLLPRFAYA